MAILTVGKEQIGMGEMQLISQSDEKRVYRDGDNAIKIFCDGFPKSEVLNEALNTARVEETGLHVSKILGVSVLDGNWAITKEFIDGKTLYEIMCEDLDNVEEYINLMVDLHIDINSKTCPLLNRLKEKMIRQIQSLTMISEVERYDLLTRLDGMPRHTKLCHGDFEPKNIIVHDGKLYVIDWVHATQGNASADVARTYLLLSLENQQWAELYLDIFCEKTDTKKSYVLEWLPIVAAAQLSKNRPQEKELLTKWVGVVDYV